MRTREAVDMQLALKVHKARRLPDHHPEHVGLHADIDALLAERETAPTRAVRPSQVRASIDRGW